MKVTTELGLRGGRPGAGHRIIQLGGKECNAVIRSSHNQHAAVLKQRRRLRIATTTAEASGQRPRVGSRIIQFSTGKSSCAIEPTGDQHLTVREERGRMVR